MVHHPGGRPKQVVLRQNLLIRCGDADLWYATETASASSGAPVFNDSWQVVGLHTGGVPARDRRGQVLSVDGEPWIKDNEEARVVWRAGLATRTSAIVRCLAAVCGDHPLIAELLTTADADASDAIVVPLGSGVDRAAGATAAPTAVDAIPQVVGTTVEPASNGARTHDRDDHHEMEAVTVTVPLRITVRQGNGTGRAPAVGVDLS
jgi:hypothetical protein